MTDSFVTIVDMLQKSAELFPEKAALMDGAVSLTYGQLQTRANALARYLIEQGVRAGDRVGISLGKSIEAVIAIFGIAAAGGVFVSLNPRLTTAQLLYHIEHCGIKCMIMAPGKNGGLGGVKDLLMIDAGAFDSILAPYLRTPSSGEGIAKTDLATIIYTSGSTGFPKGVMLNHGNLTLGAEIVTGYLKNTPDDVIISVLPFYFDYGLNQLLTALRVGATLVLQRSLFPNDICDTLIHKRVTGFAGVPSIWVMLLQPLSMFRKLMFPDLRYITNSGGSIPVAYIRELRQKLKNTQIYLMYGLTEAFRSTYLPPEEIDHRPTSIGKAIDGVTLSIINPEGKECGVDEAGELVHRGGVIFQGYWNDSSATARVLKPLPFDRQQTPAVWSGDIVKKDAQGFLYFIGRNDEMIKCLGHRISPHEIEHVLHRLEPVREAVVFGVDDEMLGHKIKAVVSLNGVPPAHGVYEKTISDFCKKELPGHMVPREIEIVDELPKTPTGKIDRAYVKKQYGLREENGRSVR
ncbi:MAG TPA: AMP-binding protein [Candidatus Omnitrophota bacterium]|nr:AMP-binding protein [Candidatus Omnitrophota bacterium]HPD84791.1 AMP-binding protein [Candidatus Omnitrophota bacterium]HRZ03649.1 AMP-binding protein [Candidatus Omnitrophota bacterium]